MMHTIVLFIALLQVTHSFGLLPVAARGFRWRLGCLMEDAAEKAKKIVEMEKCSGDLVLKLALGFLASEHEKKLLEKEKETEKKLLEKENEKKLLEKEKETEKKLVEAYFEKELSFVVQRAALEALFNEVLVVLNKPTELQALKKYLGDSTVEALNIDYVMKKAKTPSMNDINKILVNSQGRDWLFEKIGCPCTSSFPVFDGSLLYGSISEIIHRPNHKTILVSNKADEKTKQFWQCMANWKAKPFKEIDDVKAAGGDDIVNGQHEQT